MSIEYHISLREKQPLPCNHLLPCARARQSNRCRATKIKTHGKEELQRTAKRKGTAKTQESTRQWKPARQREQTVAVRNPLPCTGLGRTAKAALPCSFAFAVCLVPFSLFSFYCTYFNAYIYSWNMTSTTSSLIQCVYHIFTIRQVL
jgi:hypothetical protein